MAASTITGDGPVIMNGFEFCTVNWTIREEGTKIDTTSSCDGGGQSSDIANPMLVGDFEAFYDSTKPHHDPAQHNLRLNSIVDADFHVGLVAANRKYSFADGKITAWNVNSRVKEKVRVTGTVESQGASGVGYTVPTT